MKQIFKIALFTSSIFAVGSVCKAGSLFLESARSISRTTTTDAQEMTEILGSSGKTSHTSSLKTIYAKVLMNPTGNLSNDLDTVSDRISKKSGTLDERITALKDLLIGDNETVLNAAGDRDVDLTDVLLTNVQAILTRLNAINQNHKATNLLDAIQNYTSMPVVSSCSSNDMISKKIPKKLFKNGSDGGSLQG